MGDLTNLGKRAEGKVKEWLDHPEAGFHFRRIPDQLNGFVGSSNISDFYLYKFPYFYYLESKATYSDNFPFSMITDYQHDEMMKASKMEGVKCYVVVLFASYQQAFMFDIRDIDYQVQSGGQKSLNIKKKDKWTLPYITVNTLPSRKQLLDYDFNQAKEIF